MRIFTAVRHSSDPQFYYGGLWSSNFYPALQQLGHEVVESQIDLLPASCFLHIPDNFTVQELEQRCQITEKILEEVKQAHQKQPIDLFLSYFYNAHFDPNGFEKIHQLGIPTINFYCNSIHQFELVSKIAPKVSFAWHTEKQARQSYLGISANPIWVQMGVDPKLYHPIAEQKRQAKACFVGQRYADRDQFLVGLLNNRVALDIYGNGWGATSKSNASSNKLQPQDSVYLGRKSVRPGSYAGYIKAAWGNIQKQGVLGGVKRTIRQLQHRRQSQRNRSVLASVACGFAQDIPHTFAQYEVILNFSNVWADGSPGTSLTPHIRLRDFEAPMCRSCYLTGYTDEIAEFYELGKEIDTYSRVEELVDKTKYYLTHFNAAERLRELGYQRALRTHTWKHRFEELFKKLT